MNQDNKIVVYKQRNAGAIDSISIKGIELLSKCSKSYSMDSLGVNRKGFEKDLFMHEAINKMKKLLLSYENVMNVIKEMKEIFEKGYLREWFTYDAQYLTNRERDFKRLERLLLYIDEKGYKVYFIDFALKVILDEPLEYKGYTINTIADTVDMVIGKEDERIAVKIYNGEPEYSYQAKKERNKVINSIGLLSSFLGIYYRFHNFNVKVANWYLKNKDDEGSVLVDRFDHKQGKNIVMYDYTQIGEKEALQLFKRALSFPEDGLQKCSDCIHKSLCRMSKAVRKEKPVEKTQEVKKSSKPSFTDSQRKVVNHDKGPMGVIAVPGAGKTFSLVNRMVSLISKGVDPSSILFVTFTKKAAKEIELRVSKALAANNIQGKMPTISTFNGFGFSLLKENPMYLGNRVKLADDVDRLALIAEVLKDAPRIEKVSYDGIYAEYGLVRQLDNLFTELDEKGEEAFGERYAKKKDVKGIMKAYYLYKEAYSKNGFISFDMQISLVNEMFTKYSHLTKMYAEKYKYIMVDEFQDSSREQVDMIYAIAKHHENIVVVGDDDQSIYGFRGGSNSFMLHFKEDFPSATMVYMEDNFRSNDRILASSAALISRNQNRYEKSFISHSTSPYKPIYLKGHGIDFIPGLVNQLIGKGYAPGDIAIIARYNKRLNELQEKLENVVALSAPKDYLIEDTVFLAIYDTLNMYHNGLDVDESFYRYFGYHNNENLLGKVIKSNSLYRNLLDANVLLPIDIKDINCLDTYKARKDESPYMREGFRLIQSFKLIQYGKKLRDVLTNIAMALYGEGEYKVVDVLCDMADERAIVTSYEMLELMKNLILFGSETRVGYDATADTLNLLTAHDSKGKEFKAVIIYAMEDFKDEDEEIRLLYVAQTRAMKALFMVETPYNQCEVLNYFKDNVEFKVAE